MIHPQLQQDCHRLGEFDHSVVLLQRNASLPWFILVPVTQARDLLDLSASEQAAVMRECSAVARYVKRELGCDKVNFASIGNVVPQLHLHVVGRREGDACWPQPVWGNLPVGPAYTPDTLRRYSHDLGLA